MSGKRSSAPRCWTEAQLAKRFGWWWRDRGEGLSEAFPSANKQARNEVFRGMLNVSAFNHELLARHGIKRGDRPSYEFGAPFNRLPAQAIVELQRRWPGEDVPPAFEALDFDARPEVIQSLASLHEDIPDDGGEDGMREHIQRLALRRTIEEGATISGWTVPRYFRFNLGAHSTGTILAALETWLKAERATFRIPEPPRNKNRKHRRKSGRSFRDIEALDVWTHLSPAEAKETGFDESQKRRAARAAKVLKATHQR